MQMRELKYKGYRIWCSKLMGAWFVSVRVKEDALEIVWSGDPVKRQAYGITLAKAAIDVMGATDGST